MTLLSRKFMITCSSIAFEDFLGSSIAPQVMPPWSSAFGRFSLSRHLRKGRRRREDIEERSEVRVESFVKSASSQSNMTLVKLQNILPEEEKAPCVEIVDVGTASRHVEDHDSKKK